MVYHLTIVPMKRLLTLLTLLVASSSFSQSRFDVTMNVDGIDRQFIVVRPSGAVPTGGYPVVFMFHGTSGDGEKFYNISGWKEKGETEKILTVFPSSLEYCIDDGTPHRTTKWNNGDLIGQACPNQTFYDDVHFVRRMLDTISATFPIDRSRVYGSGFSNGGIFTSKLAVEASDIFAAIAAAAGPLNALDSGVPKRMIPLVLSLGTEDDRFYGAAGLPRLPFNDSVLFIFYNAFINRTLAVLNLSQAYSKDSNALALHYTFKTIAETAPWEFDFVLFNGLDHQYPNGVNYPVSAPDLLWEFFKRYTLPAEVVDRPTTGPEVSVWPNPAHQFFEIESDLPQHVIMRTILGETVLELDTYPHQRVQIPSLPAGMYSVECIGKNGISRTKLFIE